MENWEVQEMKDDLAILEYEIEGTRECELLKKARNYINDLEKMLVETAKDKVTKLTPIQLNDMKKYEYMKIKDLKGIIAKGVWVWLETSNELEPIYFETRTIDKLVDEGYGEYEIKEIKSYKNIINITIK